MLKNIIDAIKQSYVEHKLEWLGFAVGMLIMLAAAGLYRLSWELPERTPAEMQLPTRAPAPTRPVPTPARPAPTPTRPRSAPLQQQQ